MTWIILGYLATGILVLLNETVLGLLSHYNDTQGLCYAVGVGIKLVVVWPLTVYFYFKYKK